LIIFSSIDIKIKKIKIKKKIIEERCIVRQRDENSENKHHLDNFLKRVGTKSNTQIENNQNNRMKIILSNKITPMDHRERRPRTSKRHHNQTRECFAILHTKNVEQIQKTLILLLLPRTAFVASNNETKTNIIDNFSFLPVSLRICQSTSS
jgi:hypothetical protein